MLLLLLQLSWGGGQYISTFFDVPSTCTATDDIFNSWIYYSSFQIREDTVTRMLIVIITIFIICQSPALINKIVSTFEITRSCGSPFFYAILSGNTFIFTNSILNIFVYVHFDQRFSHILSTKASFVLRFFRNRDIAQAASTQVTSV